MKLLILGRGKTGALVAEVAQWRKHEVRVLGAADNRRGEALLPDRLRDIDVVIDFSSHKATAEIALICAEHKKPIVIGTTGQTDQDKSHVMSECWKDCDLSRRDIGN